MWKKVVTVFIISVASLAGGFLLGHINQNGGIAGLPAMLGFGDEATKDLSGKIVTTGDNIVNVHASADMDSEVLMSLPKNTEVSCIHQDEPNWLYVEVMDGVSGYVPSVKMSLVTEDSGKSSDKDTSEEKETSQKDSEEKEKTTLVSPVGLYVNVRAQASQDSEIVAFALEGDTMEQLGESNGWIHVRMADDTKGYVSSDLVSEANGTNPSSAPTRKVVITNSFARIRSEATVDSDEVTRLDRGDSGIYLEEVDGWYHIVLDDGESGYVRNDLAKVE
ncbi:MAG: SH3 domain-containing protein [Bacillota bacterium]|nr:SH3 domain-containing protein [Bacillota bacterium]